VIPPRIFVNRILWGGLAVVLLVGLVAVGLQIQRTTASPTEPLDLSDLQGGEASSGNDKTFTDLPPAFARNPFEVDGKHWNNLRKQKAVEAKGATAPKLQLRGLLKLPGRAGVWTDKGFIAVGEPYEDGKLKSVHEDRVEILVGEKTRTIPFHPDWLKRSAKFFPDTTHSALNNRNSRKPPP
jgi:hypothetical protein